MAVNFGILAQTPSIGARYMEGLQTAQADAERNMLRQAQAEQMQFQRENMLAQRGEREALAAERRRATEQQNALAQYVRSGMPQGVAGFSQFGEAGLRTAKALREAEAADLDKQLKTLDYVSRNLAAATPETYGAIRADISSISPQFGQALPVEFNPEQVMALAQRGMSLKDQIESKTRQTVVSPGATVLQGGKPIFTAPAAPEKPRQSKLLTPEEEAQELRLRLGSRPPPQPREPREPPAPIPVVDPTTGQVKYVPREQAVGMTPPQFMESLTPKERQKREALFPKAKQAVATVETTMGDLVADLENLAAHPGLTGITGVVYGRTPSVTPQAREAQALYDKIVARGGFSELQNMRAASPTGGALGNVSNVEGAQLKQAFAEIGREQATESVKKALLRAAENAKLVRQRAREAFEDTYEYRQSGGAAPAPASPNIDALLNKYK
jgi:hypothetical protein